MVFLYYNITFETLYKLTIDSILNSTDADDNDICIRIAIVNNKINIYGDLDSISDILTMLNLNTKLYIWIEDIINSDYRAINEILEHIKINNILCDKLDVLKYIKNFDKNINLGIIKSKKYIFNGECLKYINFIFTKDIIDPSLYPNIKIYKFTPEIINKNREMYILSTK